jgi:hypothetical protein
MIYAELQINEVAVKSSPERPDTVVPGPMRRTEEF